MQSTDPTPRGIVIEPSLTRPTSPAERTILEAEAEDLRAEIRSLEGKIFGLKRVSPVVTFLAMCVVAFWIGFTRTDVGIEWLLSSVFGAVMGGAITLAAQHRTRLAELRTRLRGVEGVLRLPTLVNDDGGA